MSNSATGNSANAAKNLLNQAQGLAGPGSPIMNNFQSSLGTAQANQTDLFSGTQGNIGTLQTAAASGGYDPATFDPTLKGYSDLASTGGYTPEQGQAFVRQATEGIGSTYGALEDQLKRNQTATGGLGTSGISQMARQLGQAQGQGTLNAQVDLNREITGNKLAGLGGESSLLASQAGNKLQGTEAAGSQLNQLYNTQTGQVTALGNQILSSLGLDFSTQEQAANILARISQNPSMFQSLMGTIGGTLQAGAGAYQAYKDAAAAGSGN
jgi:hypothetical protein